MNKPTINEITVEIVSAYLSERNQMGHKNSFGHVLVLGGCPGMTGAAGLAARAALTVGAGLVTAASWQESYFELVTTTILEVMTAVIEKDFLGNRNNNFSKYDAIVLGPGLGKESRARRLVLHLFNNYDGPVVLDADGINALSYAKDRDLLKRRNGPTILTPHNGEFSRFMEINLDQVLGNTNDLIKRFSEETGAFLLLKGPISYLGLSNDKIYFYNSPNSGLATAGSGDILAGMIGGMWGQTAGSEKKQWDSATCLSLVLHSLAGKLGIEKLGERSLLASSLLEYLPQAFGQLERIRGNRGR